jgi:serine/threonine protein kinase
MAFVFVFRTHWRPRTWLVALLSAVDHPNLPAFHDAFVALENCSVSKHTSLMMVTELCSGGSLGDRLGKSPAPSWATRIEFGLGLSSAVAYLHARNIIHRDIKVGSQVALISMRTRMCSLAYTRNQPWCADLVRLNPFAARERVDRLGRLRAPL